MLYPVESLLKVHEDEVEVLLVLQVPLAQYLEVEDLLRCTASLSKACLFFCDYLLCL
ncbi:hypothetical protein DPMN_090049 [Dreissena polymorpha]|uniref:Uncharacterized protein n=1 Tax=Dreissena polymorpha TaxID=45954 RepID=A0A9D4KX05_DREPO|nr:hypothetical protein DPMN_090049 [Dreissena polymorpha]